MKIKILEHNDSGTPKFKYVGVRSILEVDIKDKLKFIILPIGVGAVNNPWDLNYVPTITSDLLIFHDGSPGTDLSNYNHLYGRQAYQPHINRGSEYMFWLDMNDPTYATGVGGWTPGTPFDYFSEKTILGWKKTLELQGATYNTKGYCYINWTEDERQQLQFNGYTGPPGWSDNGKLYYGYNEYDRMQKAWAKHFLGGIATDTGEYAHGLRHHFPGISFGLYDIPTWWMSDRMFVNSLATVENDTDVVAQILVDRAPELWDAIQLLMPSVYAAVNNPLLHRCQSAQAVMLCRKINEKLVQKGKTPLQIVPFVTGFCWTIATGIPYTTYKYDLDQNSFPAKKYNIYKAVGEYIPPYTRMTDYDIIFQQFEPIIQEGAHGAIYWMGQAYRLKQICGRTLNCTVNGLPTRSPCNEDIVVSFPKLNLDGSPVLDAQGNFQYDAAWRKGPTGAPNKFSDKDMWRQAISADLNYLAGVCMGITGNRWWYNEVKGTTKYTPTEWLPLKGREGITFGYPNQPIGSAGMSKPETVLQISDYITNVIASGIEAYKKTWLRIKYNK